MPSSKKDFYIVSRLLTDFINNLTEVQFDNLVNGTADIRYYEKGIDSETKEKYNTLLYEIATKDNIEEKIKLIESNDELSKKSKLMDFCKYFKIEFKAKDTNSTIMKNIIDFIDKNKENVIYKYNKAESLEDGIDKLAQRLEDIMDIEEARNLMANSKMLESKSNLLKLSKKLNVFTDREASYDTIVDNIIKSVVEAKIRSYTIRKKI